MRRYTAKRLLDQRHGQLELFAQRISAGGGKIEVVPADQDIFGDGTVVMLHARPHAESSQFAREASREWRRTAERRSFQFHENYDTDGMPPFNTNRADTLASSDRFKKITATLRATVILQHDARDTTKLPAFPIAAK